jgi:succinyl-diaminopimelate desuccinylase
MLKILNELINTKSVSPDDGGLLRYISEILSEAGFRSIIKEFGLGEETTKNLYAEFGKSGKNLCFAGHVDVVPSGDESLWKYDPHSMKIEDGVVYGRGAVDMKGAIAAMIQAGIEWSKNNDGKISFLLTSDEEGSGKYGTKEMLKWMNESDIKIDFAIVGEPTSSKEFGDTIKIGRRGSINFNLKIIGKQGHAAYPELAMNPNHILVRVLDKLIKHKIDDGNKYFDRTNLEITSIDVANKTSNVIPPSACAKFNIRFCNEKTAEEIIKEIDDIIKSCHENYELEYNISARAFLAETNSFTHEFKKIVDTECNLNANFSTAGGTSDARFIKDYCPLLEFGLLNSTAHHVDERTEISHLQKLFTVYYRAINSFHST